MHDVRSKTPPWGYTPQSNSHWLPDTPPLGLDIDRCITTEIYLGEILVTLTNYRLPTTTTASSNLL